jgi:hypothetical protein
MKTLLCIGFLAFCVSASHLDSLIKKNQLLEQKAKNVHGFVYERSFQATPMVPMETAKIVMKETRAKSIYEEADPNFTLLLSKIEALEVDNAKRDMLIESLQKQSESHAENSSFILKLVDLILGAVATIVVGLVGAWITARFSKGTNQRQTGL